ncbi:MAG TPA: hypothetical protein VFR67_17670 [Pilimelia sp.]|nr:hypothetical protein [Pilimelia sp.]
MADRAGAAQQPAHPLGAAPRAMATDPLTIRIDLDPADAAPG